MIPLQKRKKRIPLPKADTQGEKPGVTVRIISNTNPPLPPVLPRELRRQELSLLHGIPERDIFVDPVNGVELYRNPTTGGWLTNPVNRGVK